MPAVEIDRVRATLLALLESITRSGMQPRPKDIHKLRVAIKKIRAWLRLCREVEGKTETYLELENRLRQLSADFSVARDREVLRSCLQGLLKKYPGKKVQRLVEEVQAEFAALRPVVPIAAMSCAELETLRHELFAIPVQPASSESQRKAIKRRYRKVCHHGRLALAEQGCAKLHAWRKQVKTLGYQVTMAGTAVSSLQASLPHLNRLGNTLGSLHDLCVVQELLEQRVAHLHPQRDHGPLLKRITRERTQLLRATTKLYHRLCDSE